MLRQNIQLAADIMNDGGDIVDLQNIGVDLLDILPAGKIDQSHRAESLKFQHQLFQHLQVFHLLFIQLRYQFRETEAGVFFI